jgi:hypothetical protein
VWRAAVRRLVVLFVLLGVGVTLVSLLLGLLFGAAPQRSLSLGFSVTGSFLLVMGFFVGSRGPVRLIRRDRGQLVGARMAEPDERVETINVSALFVAVGFVLLIVGVALDPRYSMF